jgi:hypothetical protein
VPALPNAMPARPGVPAALSDATVALRPVASALPDAALATDAAGMK